MIEILSSGRKRILPPELTKQSLGERECRSMRALSISMSNLSEP